MSALDTIRTLVNQTGADRLEKRLRAMPTNDIADWLYTSTMGLGASVADWQRYGGPERLTEARMIAAETLYALEELDRRLGDSAPKTRATP